MNDALGSGMIRGWVMLLNMGLTGLLAAILIGVSVFALVELIASVRDGR